MEQGVKRKRSQIACQRCNERRVRCDASTRGLPCSNCVHGHLEANCHLINSKRSRGERGRFAPAKRTAGAINLARASSDSTVDVIQHPQTTEKSNTSSSSRSRDSCQIQSPRACPDAGQTDQDEQWSLLVSNDHPPAVNNGRVAYLGESWTLSYVLKLKSSAASLAGALHLALPAESVEWRRPRTSGEQPVESHSSKDSLVNNIPKDIQDALIDAYFAHNYIVHPIVSQSSFRQSLGNESVSQCLLLSILYVGALHVNEAVIYRLGFSGRLECLKTFYQRAKAVFDADKEKDRVAVVQSAFLLHNWWQSPTATMDPWAWLGLSVRLAQNMGMHRSTNPSPLPLAEKSLWKRIWWSLYARDRQIALALGKPSMIHDMDCDVEPLTLDDFEPNDPLIVKLFVIQQVKLSKLYGIALSSQFSPRLRNEPRTSTDMIRMQHRIQRWRDQLPSELQYHEDADSHGHYSLLALLLHVLFNGLVILLQRPKALPRQTKSALDFDDSVSCEIAFEAATSTTRIAEIIMSEFSLTQCPLFFTSALFSAMTMHALRGPKAEHELNICMIAMRTLSTMYSAAGWIRLLFQRLADKKRGRTKSNKSSSKNSRKTSPLRSDCENREAPTAQVASLLIHPTNNSPPKHNHEPHQTPAQPKSSTPVYQTHASNYMESIRPLTTASTMMDLDDQHVPQAYSDTAPMVGSPAGCGNMIENKIPHHDWDLSSMLALTHHTSIENAPTTHKITFVPSSGTVTTGQPTYPPIHPPPSHSSFSSSSQAYCPGDADDDRYATEMVTSLDFHPNVNEWDFWEHVTSAGESYFLETEQQPGMALGMNGMNGNQNEEWS